MTTTTHQAGPVLDIPLSSLKASPRNARKAKHTDAALEALAASIAAKGVLQPLVVEPEAEEAGAPTGSYFVTIGEGRRQALLRLAKRKVIRKNHPVRCVIDTEHDAHEISLDENVTRSGMHPADEFEAFDRLAREQGWGPEEIAARFGVTPAVVRQRLKLASVSPTLVQAYRDEAMTLDQLMAFTVSDDPARQEAVWAGLGWNKSPATIRRFLMETHVPATDRRALFIGPEAYVAAGGQIVRDLFSEDEGGWFADPQLLDQLVATRIAEAAEEVRQAEGWKWAAAADRQSGQGLRRAYPHQVERSEEERLHMQTLADEYDRLGEEWQHAETLPPDVEARLSEIDKALDAFEAWAYDPDDVARGGVLVLLEPDGTLRVERGFIRPEDEPDDEPEPEVASEPAAAERPIASDEVDDGLSPLSDRLVADLTAHRTAGLRDVLAEHPEVALATVVHVLALRTFYRGYDLGSCLEIEVKSAALDTHAPGIADSTAGRSIEARHADWAGRVPADPRELWAFVLGLSPHERLALLAHCASLSVNAVRAWERRPQALAHADRLACTLALDMRQYWVATVASYFGRVSKAHILEAVREGYSPEAAERMAGLKKGPMADVAEEALAGKGWLPALLRRPEGDQVDPPAEATGIAAE